MGLHPRPAEIDGAYGTSVQLMVWGACSRAFAGVLLLQRAACPEALPRKDRREARRA